MTASRPRKITSVLIGEAAVPEQVNKIHSTIVGTPRVEQVIHLRTVHLGPDDLLVAAKIGVPAGADAEDVAVGPRRRRGVDPPGSAHRADHLSRTRHLPGRRPSTGPDAATRPGSRLPPALTGNGDPTPTDLRGKDSRPLLIRAWCLRVTTGRSRAAVQLRLSCRGPVD